MTLHEAIKQMLTQRGHSMTTTEIANELNKNKWYSKADGSEITAFQIHGRTSKYPELFVRDGSMVSLANSTSLISKVIQQKIIEPKKSNIVTEISYIEMNLINEKDFKKASDIDGIVPDKPGIYCVKISNEDNLPKTFNTALRLRNHKVLYIGIASKSLKKRFLEQEFRAKGHGTFFRSIGAVLGFRPESGSLTNKINKKNYTFNAKDKQQIISWINANLLVNWVEYDGDVSVFETKLIKDILPLLNIAKNPFAMTELKALRNECERIANQ